MLHQKLFFKDLLDYSTSKSNLSKKLDVKQMPRLSEIISLDNDSSTVSISATLKLNDQLNPSISGEIIASLSLICQRCLGSLNWNETIEYSVDFIKEADPHTGKNNIDYISINDEGIILLDLLEDEVLSSLPMSIMHKNIELCENIDKLSMFLGSSDEETEKKNKPFSDLSEILGKDGN
ncbi:MAG: hypothetical protein CMQ73_01020 [Gammaproteobacteria bacterium]|nr:hypothetical protein [Gammaproteobacteria bacterium]OUT96775.1 MAG: hypothetical protein CBB96_01195 [Gammaproteobacteria bacterium TMED36]|tara:strand:+ start:1451 stop:1987 length:537 start_codon:yes stop_codon:yes gene_type:complete